MLSFRSPGNLVERDAVVARRAAARKKNRRAAGWGAEQRRAAADRTRAIAHDAHAGECRFGDDGRCAVHPRCRACRNARGFCQPATQDELNQTFTCEMARRMAGRA